MPRSLRNSMMLPPAAPSTAYISGSNLNSFTTSSGQARWVVTAGYIDLGRVYTLDRLWTYLTTGGTGGTTVYNVRIYPARADGGPPPDGTAPLYVGGSVSCAASGALIWTPSPTLTLQRFYVATNHDCTGSPVTLRVSTSGANRGMLASAAGAEPASAPLINGWQWTEASYLTTNTWNNGTSPDVTTNMPGFCFRVV